MSIAISASKYEALVASGNYLFIQGYDCQIGDHFVHNVDETPTVRRQIERYNALLKLLMDAWRVLPYVASVDGKPAVFVTREVDTLFETQPFPHERLAAVVALTERIAQDVANPDGKEGKYLAPKSTLSKAELLAITKVPEEAIKDVLPFLALRPSEGVDILVRDTAGEERTLVLPPTEALRKPTGETEHPGESPMRRRGLAGVVAGEVPVYGFLALEDGTFLRPMDGSVDDFVAGQTYVFHETAPRFTFSKQVRCVVCDGEQEELSV